MFGPFFTLAAVSRGRQRAFRQAVVVHIALLAGCLWWAAGGGSHPGLVIGYALLTAGIAEGAILLGWRLTQLPKSQSLEFLLVSQFRPAQIFLAESAVGVSRLALVTLSGLPVLVLLAHGGYLEWLDLLPLLEMPFTWGVVTGVGLTVWAYELVAVRRWAERALFALIVVYLAIGVLAGERLRLWLEGLPPAVGRFILVAFEATHRYNPFATVRLWMTDEFVVAYGPTVTVELAALGVCILLTVRASFRLRGHFQDRHYRPVLERKEKRRPVPGDRPLSWWAVKRVTEYSGRVNLWLAGGFGVLYALYLLAGPAWPAWLGRGVFTMFENAGGVPVWATALVVLAAVPAAFQYGLWDNSAQDRCRRLELLLLTRLTARDYWHASAAAAWRRGRGYFAVAALLWAAAAISRPETALAAVAGLAAGVILWGFYFALGFRAFSRGGRANNLGLVLTLALPGLAFWFQHQGWSRLAALVPPGSVYAASRGVAGAWAAGAVACALATFWLVRYALAHCEADLCRWYDRHHGQIVLE